MSNKGGLLGKKNFKRLFNYSLKLRIPKNKSLAKYLKRMYHKAFIAFTYA